MEFRWRQYLSVLISMGAFIGAVSCKSSSPANQPAASKAATVVAPSTVPAQSVNVVVITLDTVRADHLHCYGDGKIKTPNIDRLAQQGVLFERAVTQTPLTAPSHASIFTGTNPNVHHVRDTGGFALGSAPATLAATLQKSGWNTAGFISAPVLGKQFGFNRGFAMYDDQMTATAKSPAGPDVKDEGVHLAATRPANVTVDHAIQWLKTQHGAPFFLWLHLYDAHQPYDPPAQFRAQYPGDPYDAAIAFEDHELGRFFDEVHKQAPAGNTIFVLISDHGEGFGEHGEQGHGIFLYDSTLRIAWIMAGPKVPAGVRVQQQAREIDVFPTLLDLLGGRPAPGIQGTSMVPAFSGHPVASDSSYEETLYPKLNMGWSELRGVHTAHWMYIRAPKPELYDLVADPGELRNVIADHPKEYRELEAQLKQWIAAGGGENETVVTNQMDTQTLAQLRSLGYVGGSSDDSVRLDGKGSDPKDMVGVLKISDMVTGLGSEKLSDARKIALLKQALLQDPKNAFLYCTLGDIYQQMNQTDAALETYQAALQHGVQNQMLFSQMGDLYFRVGNMPRAILFLQQAVQMNPNDVEMQYNLANAYIHNGQSAEAEAVLNKILKQGPNAQAENGLGILAMGQHNYAGARTHFQLAIQLRQDYPEVQYSLGVACLQVHDANCARTAFQIFLKQASPATFGDLISHAEYNLGMTCAKLQDTPCARTALKQFLQKPGDVNETVLSQVKQTLGSLR